MSFSDSKEIREIFKSIDTNGDGKLSREEMINGYKSISGIVNSEEFIDRIINEVDTDKSGFIDFDEFLKASYSESILYTRINLKKAFDMFDLDSSGKISAEELQQVFSIGNLSNSIWQDVIEQADKNNDGEIDFEEFCEFITGLSKTC